MAKFQFELTQKERAAIEWALRVTQDSKETDICPERFLSLRFQALIDEYVSKHERAKKAKRERSSNSSSSQRSGMARR